MKVLKSRKLIYMILLVSVLCVWGDIERTIWLNCIEIFWYFDKIHLIPSVSLLRSDGNLIISVLTLLSAVSWCWGRVCNDKCYIDVISGTLAPLLSSTYPILCKYTQWTLTRTDITRKKQILKTILYHSYYRACTKIVFSIKV